MKILVANLGSTSFKYRLFDMSDQRQLARGGIERDQAASFDQSEVVSVQVIPRPHDDLTVVLPAKTTSSK